MLQARTHAVSLSSWCNAKGTCGSSLTFSTFQKRLLLFVDYDLWIYQVLGTCPSLWQSKCYSSWCTNKASLLGLWTTEILVHDQRGEFWTDVMTSLAELLDIQPYKITSHQPNLNGVVERVQGTLHSIFGKLVSQNQRDWCKLVPYIRYA